MYEGKSPIVLDLSKQKVKTREESQTKSVLNYRKDAKSACNCRINFLGLKFCGDGSTDESVGSHNK